MGKQHCCERRDIDVAAGRVAKRQPQRRGGVSPCFSRPGKQTSINLWCATRYLVLVIRHGWSARTELAEIAALYAGTPLCDGGQMTALLEVRPVIDIRSNP
jgi:hypothetical protein